jgi:hypothetical protein
VRLTTCSALAWLVLAGVAAAANGPHVQERIVPGQAIGKVRIGMTLKQVKAVLGQPEAVIRRERRGFARTWVEYSWNFTSWRVAFQVYKGKYEVVSIRSSVRGERTREGVGYGTLAARLQRTYRTQCRPAWSALNERDRRYGSTYMGYGCVTRGVFFLVGQLCGNVPTAGRCAERDTRWVVMEFGVVRAGEPLPFELSDYSDSFPPIP